MHERQRWKAGVAVAVLALTGTWIAAVGSGDGAPRGSTFEITRSSADAGGGESVSASFELAGTMGQPDAHIMSSSSFELAGGFWIGGQADNCPADLTGDNNVNSDDLFQLLGSWGACGACSSDLTDDGVVNADDLFQLLGAWGVCLD